MAEFINNAVLAVPVGSNVLFTDTPVCPCPCVRHRQGSGIFTLRGGHTYVVEFSGNISGATAGTQVDLAFALDGEALPGTIMASTPSAANAFNNVSTMAVIEVPCGCCYTLSVENVGTTELSVANANLVIFKEN